MSKKRRIPLWISIFLGIIILFMTPQVYMYYFDHSMLNDAGITIVGVPDVNVMYTTAGRLIAMIAISLFALFSQNPNHFVIVYLLGIFREGQETFIDPLFPYANAPASASIDFGLHIIILALEIWALIVVYKIAEKENKDRVTPSIN